VAQLTYILTGLTAYFLGSIPTGFLMGKARGIDIRTLGSGNIGATNVLRHLGTPAGIVVLLADAFKGWVAVAVASKLICGWLYPSASSLEREWLEIVSGLMAVTGHNYTIWLGFKGGKGIATSAGVLLALVPLSLAIVLAIWILVFALTRYVSLASICGAFALPFATWLTGRSGTLIVITAAMGALAIYKHKANIERLLNGTENRIRKRKPAATAGKIHQNQ
jgi:acyl phosphate:glycerol-3-phosphate acyltransferase